MSSSKHYPWKRFWCPRGGTYSLDSHGFLLDPEQVPQYYTGVFPFEEIVGRPCLALLGEPGIGKSQAMRDERMGLEAALREKGESLLWLDLKTFGDESRLLRRSFESDEFREWIRGKQIIHLYLDSLDECRLRVPQVAALLMEQLREVREHISRLRLRIACRTAEWPAQLEDELPELFGKEQVGAFELVPLRREDVRLAAEIEAVEDPEAFLSEIEEKDAQPLAIKPVTLRFLINLYKRDGKFPARQVDLYREGCQILVAEPSQSRKDSKQIGKLSPTQRLAVAARIPAVSIFCKRASIYSGPDPVETSVDDVRVDELSGGTESVSSDVFSVGEAEIREVLDTGLFSSRGPNRLGFAHQTYAEFLAALYLSYHDLEPDQMLSLVRHPEVSDNTVVPQLAETAAWLAEMNPVVFQELLKCDPKILLRSDVAQASPQDRAALVSGLLELFVAQELSDDNDLRDGYRRLKHPGLAKQLTPYLLLGPEAWLVRRVAIDIAESCNISELQDLLLQIALDPQDFQPTRVEAAKAITRIGDQATRKRLMPLARGVAEDINDELKGVTLQALWLDSISAKEVFEALTPIKDRQLYGSYRDFLARYLINGLQDQDLSEALYWLKGQASENDPRSVLRRVGEEILARAFQKAHEPSIRALLIDTLMARSEKYNRIQEPEIIQKAGASLQGAVRRQMIEDFMERRDSFSQKRWCLSFHGPRLVQPEDFGWILSKARENTSESASRDWAQLALSIFSVEQPGQADAMLTEAVHSTIIADVFRGFIEPVALDSEEAAELRSYYNLDLTNKSPSSRLLEPSLDARIEKLLQDFERGELNAWWMLVRELTLEATSTYYGDEFEPLLTKLPGWKNSSPVIRERILQAARHYIVKQEPIPKKWFGKSIFFRPDSAGYKAFCLLAQEELALLDNLDSEAWEKWTPVIIGYPSSPHGEAEAALHADLIARAYRKVPEIFLDFLNQAINLDNRKHDYLFILQKLGECWDDRLLSALNKKVRQSHLKAGSLQNLMEKLIQLGSGEAEQFARSLIRLPIPQDARKRARSRAAALALIGYADDAGWEILKPSLEADSAWRREVFEALGNNHEDFQSSLAQRLKEEEVADLYLWLARDYPQRDDPELSGWIGPREGIALFRDSLLRHLRDRGTAGACRALEKIVHNLPEVSNLKFYLLAARQNMLRRTWIPPSPASFLQFSSQRGAKLVRNADELLEAILESLHRLEGKLQGKPPMARYLWDGSRPKDEEDLSDWIKIHLDHELNAYGIVTLREVQIERGEETDLHVTAQVPGFEPGTWEPVSVIIEVKGSWNPDVKTAMKTQLVETYLRNNDCRHGIYLVGWYRCDAWDPNDYRSQSHKTWTWEDARKDLAEQAKLLSQGDLEIRASLLDVRLRD